MNTRRALWDIAKSWHDPEAPKQPGHVQQIWEDGEITSQKGGELLWQRTLHCWRPPITGIVKAELPVSDINGHSYIWVRHDVTMEQLDAWYDQMTYAKEE